MRRRKIFAGLALGFLVAWHPLALRGQMVLGQYEEEAPVRTWNIFGPTGAAGLGLGDTMFTLAADASVLFTNPALMTRLPVLAVSLGGSLQAADFFRYGPVNTGPLSTLGNARWSTAAADLAALSVRILGWNVGLGLALSEIYDRPETVAQSASPYYLFSFGQSGFLRTLNLSLGREIVDGLSLGLGFNLVSGRWEWKLTDAWSGVTITDSRRRNLSGYTFNGGLCWQATGGLSLAAIFRAPYQRKASSRSDLHYDAQSADILIQGSGEDTFHEPLVLGSGLSWTFLDKFLLAAEVTFWNWSSYRASLMGEDTARNFRDTWKVGLGLEHLSWFRLFNQDFDCPARFGLVYDPQPMSSPQSSYLNFSLGLGLHWRGIHLDLGTMVGTEKGSGQRLTAQRLALTLTVFSGPRPAGG
jgi:long-subunit fatty acid transport protein